MSSTAADLKMEKRRPKGCSTRRRDVFVGMDLGKRRDHTAIAVVERRESYAVHQRARLHGAGGAVCGADGAGDAVSGGGGAGAGDCAERATAGRVLSGGGCDGGGGAGGGYAAVGAAGVRGDGGDDYGRGSSASGPGGVECAEAGSDERGCRCCWRRGSCGLRGI